MGRPIPKRMEDFARKYVPLLRTYLQREETRDLDKVIRDELAKQLQGLLDQLTAAKQTLVDNKVLTGLDLLDRASHRLEKLRDSIRFAARGYSGVFDLEHMADDQLNRLLEFDQMLFDKVAILAGALNQALAAPGDLKKSLAGLEAQIKEFETTLDNRDAYARERKAGK